MLLMQIEGERAANNIKIGEMISM